MSGKFRENGTLLTFSKSSLCRSGNPVDEVTVGSSSEAGNVAGRTTFTLSPTFRGLLRKAHLSEYCQRRVHDSRERHTPALVLLPLSPELVAHAIPEPSIQLCMRVDPENFYDCIKQ